MNSETAPLAREPMLVAENLSKVWSQGLWPRRTHQRVLDSVSFVLRASRIVALVGESGSGKSTVARLMTRLYEPTSGALWLHGHNVLHTERRPSLGFRRSVQMIFQDPFASLNPLHSVHYHLARPLLRHQRVASPVELNPRIDALLQSVGLSPADASKFPHELSGGQRQRVAIARALAVNPQVLIADEPTSMLDVSIRMGILNLMLELKASRNLAWLYITHDLASARYVADETLVLFGGQLMEGGATETLLQAPAHPYTQLLLASVPGAPPSKVRALPRVVSSSTGCAFASRCPEASAICGEQRPGRTELKRLPVIQAAMPGPPAPDTDTTPHWVRCHART